MNEYTDLGTSNEFEDQEKRFDKSYEKLEGWE